MRVRRSIRSRSGRRRLNKGFELQLTAMMDILTIILVFLLKSYSAATHNFTVAPGMKLPMSAAPDEPVQSFQVILTREGMIFENERILDFVQTADSVTSIDPPKLLVKPSDMDEGNRRIVPLYDALTKAREQSETLRVKSSARDEEGNPLPFDGELAITADKSVEYDMIRRVMYTAATAGYRTFRFLALRRDI